MPRKPTHKPEKITVIINKTPVTVILHPPSGARKAWYAYWAGLDARRSTGCRRYQDAVVVAETMVRKQGRRPCLSDAALTDEQFESIQRRHFSKKKDEAAKTRASKTLADCLEAIAAFRDISGVSPISLATPDDCERFQSEALKQPRNWRKLYPNSKEESARPIKPNTVIKWSRALQAAFERANRNAGKKCVRGVVEENKLLESNPWKQFTWIEGTEPKKRRFSSEELISLLDFFEAEWTQVTVAALFAKVSLWMWARRLEVASLTWESLRVVRGQYHFDFVGKWGVRKWARIPVGLYKELRSIKATGQFVFAAYIDQLRCHYADRPVMAQKIGRTYNPTAFADWFHDKLVEWSASAPNGHATQHAFRKTGLQLAYRGGVADTKIAADASITESVMLDHYVDDTDEELLLKSNRTFDRIVSSLPLNVAERYGYSAEEEGVGIEAILKAAIERQDWDGASQLLERLKKNGRA
jgi:hypothetical protein